MSINQTNENARELTATLREQKQQRAGRCSSAGCTKVENVSPLKKHMLPSKDRLSFREVEEVFRNGHRKTSPLFSFISIVPAHRTAFAVSVSKKVAPNAVDRNKIRRRIYSALRTVKDRVVKAQIVFLPKKETINIPFGVLKKEITNSLARANIF